MLPNDWRKEQLGKVLKKVVLPVLVETEKTYREIGIRSHGKGIFHKPELTGEALGEKRVFWVVPDALVLNIVFAWEQAVAVTSVQEQGFIASHRFPMYQAVEGKSDVRYIFHFFKTARGKDLLELASPGGAGRNKTLGQKDFEGLEIVLPPFQQQKKIAKLLDTWDDVVLAVGKLIVNTKLSQRIVTNDLLFNKKRLKQFSAPWNCIAMTDIGEVVSGGTPDTDIESYWDGDIAWATPSDVSNGKGRYISDTKRKISAAGLAACSARRLPVGTILVCTRATIGVLAIAKKEVTTNQGFKSLIPNSGFSSDFLYHLFSASREKFEHLACGSTFLELSKKDFERIQFTVPSLAEQQAIANVLNIFDDQLNLLNSYRAVLIRERYEMVRRLTAQRAFASL